jgi:hypothetical protein
MLDQIILSVLNKIVSFSRLIEKNKTYRIPKGDGDTDLFQVLDVTSNKLKLKNLKTNQTKIVNKSNFQKRLDAGEIYVSACSRNELRGSSETLSMRDDVWV